MQSEAIKGVWRLIEPSPSYILEMRALPSVLNRTSCKPITRQFTARGFMSIDAIKADFEKTALSLNQEGYNIYVVMNPIIPTFNGVSASDSDIACRKLLLVDIDRASGTKQPATDQEVESSKALADEVRGFLTKRGFPDPIRMMSGNGHHLYCRLNSIPNNDESTKVVQEVLTGLALRFNTPEFKIDTVVHNASRITKVPGTISRKGKETAERPYRMAEII